MAEHHTVPSMTRTFILALFIAAVLGGGILIGASNVPGEWYASLNKPPFNPPNWVFAPVWSVLYIMIAIAGWRVWMRERGGTPMAIWFVQLGLNFLWPPIFFGLQRPGAALIVIAALLVTIAMFIVQTCDNDRVSAWLFTPYAAWVAFAAVLNMSIVMLN